jgi:hypothetical protein
MATMGDNGSSLEMANKRHMVLCVLLVYAWRILSLKFEKQLMCHALLTAELALIADSKAFEKGKCAAAGRQK